MRESKSLALPLGDTPMALEYYNIKVFCCQGVCCDFEKIYKINSRLTYRHRELLLCIFFGYGAVIFNDAVTRVGVFCQCERID